jgi:hypothetical protein
MGRPSEGAGAGVTFGLHNRGRALLLLAAAAALVLRVFV